ncbi:MAG TPA: tripartite tricarboxylate transporter substrate binding protein [Xanthobacteraceae bacterium]|nr:tripartite tricarboxylate transporter substrate binding protein [Xanthobacteraceae bacterium]
MTALTAYVLPAQAQQYPAQDIHFICAFPPGSGADVLVRYFAEKVRPLTGRNIVVENRAGAGGNIAMQFVSRAKPDGYTIFVHAGSSIASNMHLYKTPPFPDAGKAIQVAATINRQPFMMVVDAKTPYKTVADVTAAMKPLGEKATYGSAAPTGTVMGELYKIRTGVNAVEVVYKSAPDGLNDMASGSVQFGFHDPVFSLAQQREGRLRILGVSTGERLQASPDLPTMKEQGIDMDLTGWWAAMVPQGTPKAVVDQINKWFVQVVSSPETKEFLAKFGGDTLIETPDQGQDRLLKDVMRWGEYIKAAKIQPQG